MPRNKAKAQANAAINGEVDDPLEPKVGAELGEGAKEDEDVEGLEPEDQAAIDQRNKMAELASRAVQAPVGGAYEQFIAQHLATSVIAEPLKKVQLICDAIQMLSANHIKELEINLKEVENIHSISLSLQNAILTHRESILEIPWGFPATNVEFSKRIMPWINNYEYSAIYDPGKVDWQKFFAASRSMTRFGVESMKAAFLLWAMPICMSLFTKLCGKITPSVYEQVMSSIANQPIRPRLQGTR